MVATADERIEALIIKVHQLEQEIVQLRTAVKRTKKRVRKISPSGKKYDNKD